jgi:hypothetical protein
MEDARSVLMMALIIITSPMGDDVSVKSTQGQVLFQKKGTLISETEHSIIVFHVDCAQVLDAVQKLKELISKVGDNEHHRWGNDMVLDVTNVQGHLAAMGALLEVEDGQRVKKSFATWAISFFGLWKFWSIKSVEGRLKHMNEAVQLTAKTIDSTIQFAAENADIKELERYLLESNRRRTRSISGPRQRRTGAT